MEEGVVQNNIKDNEITEFIINEGFPSNVIPVVCILSGSRGYGINLENSNRDYLGIHFMDTWECLEHPTFRSTPLVIKRQYTNELEEMKPGTKGGDISLDSFEMWKFIDLLLKGSTVAYELLHMPQIHQGSDMEGLLSLCKNGLTNRIGKSAKGVALHDWRRDRSNRKKTIFTYYRLAQAIMFLKEQEFEWRTEALLEYAAPLIKIGNDIFTTYSNPATRKDVLNNDEMKWAPLEIEGLINEVDKAMMLTSFPNQCPRKLLDEILQRIKRIRSKMI